MGAGLLDLIAHGGSLRAFQDNQQQEAQTQGIRANTGLTQEQTSQEAIKTKLLQQGLNDQNVMRSVFTDPALQGGDGSVDPNKSFGEFLKRGGSAQGALQLQTHFLDMRKKAADLTKDENANYATNLTNVGQTLGEIQTLPQEQRGAALQNAMPQLKKWEPDYDWSKMSTDDASLLAHKGVATYTAGMHAKQAETAEKEALAKKAGADTQKMLAELPGVTANSALATAKADAVKNAMSNPQALLDQVDQLGLDKPAAMRTKAMVQFSLQRGDYDGAIKAIDLASSKQADIEKEIDPRVQKNKIDTAVAQGKAMSPVIVERAAAEQAAKDAARMPSAPALDLMAEDALNGKYPSSRSPVMYAKVMERAAALAQERGMSNQQVLLSRNAASANKAALNSVTKQYETLKPFAEMAEKNADILEQKMGAVTNLGAPVLNTPLRELEQKFGGNTSVTAFKAALMPVQADFARILNSPTGGGVLSDHAREEMQTAISAGATPAQIKSALDVFRQDARNRKDSYEANIADLQHRSIAANATNPPAPQTSAALPQGAGKAIDKATVQQFYKAAGNDPAKARQLAVANGWKIQ